MYTSAAPAPSSRRRRRRALAITALAASIAVSLAAYRLANSGATGAEINVLPGSTNGAVAVVTPLSSEVTRPNGGAQLDAGVALERVAVAQSAASHLQLLVAWTNVKEAVKVFNNPNVQISIGLYHPIHSGVCTSEDTESNKGKEVDAPRVTITDTDSKTLCGALDEGAKGSASVSKTGKLLLAKSIVGGYLDPSIAGKAALKECTATKEEWCQPKTVTDENQDALYLVASIVTPGGIPQGQQSQAGSLNFFAHAKRLK